MGTDERWMALALIYGPPDKDWYPKEYNMHGDRYRMVTHVIPLMFRMALDKCFDPANVRRVGLYRMACDYADWYLAQEKQHDSDKAHRHGVHGAESAVRTT